MQLSLVIPTLNEERGIAETLDALPRDKLEAMDLDLEIVVVDGDSEDATREEAKERGARVVVETRLGYGRAYKTGFAEATGDLIATMDADGTYPADALPSLIQHLLDEDLDFITTDRFGYLQEGAMSGKHRFGNWVLSTTMRTLYGIDVNDSQSGMWVFRSEILDDHLPTSDGMPFSEEIKIRCFLDPELGCEEVPIAYHPRTGEAKIQSWSDGLENLRHLFSIRSEVGR